MDYKVIITLPAKRRLEMYIEYTVEKLHNRQAAKAIIDDAMETKNRFSNIAANLKLCDDPVLAKYGYRKIRFSKHDYVMLYRIVGKTVVVDGMYHELQDYESIFAEEMNLK